MDQSAPDREAHEPGSIVNIQLSHDASPMAISRLDADSQDYGNLLGRLAFRDKLKDLTFTRAQHVARRSALVEVRLDNCA